MSDLLSVDPALLAANLDRAPFEVHHELVDHPLLTLDALGDLADSLPTGPVRAQPRRRPRP